MARIRTTKPEFFRHEGLQDLEAAHPGQHTMLVFNALWGHCDKHGIFEFKPRALKLDILPYLQFDMAETLSILVEAGFIRVGEARGKQWGHIQTFPEHQRITGKESQADSKFPQVTEISWGSTGEISETQPGSTGEASEITGREGKGTRNEEGSVTRARDVPHETETAIFEIIATIKAKYPRAAREDWITAEKLARQLVLSGEATWPQLEAGVERYQRHCKATNRISLNPSRFFGDVDRPWSQEWPIPEAKHVNGFDPTAAAAWDRLIASDGAVRDAAAQHAIAAIGGWSRIQLRTEFEAPRIKREFCDAYRSATP